jgi:RNA polymerase sigma factor FliA
MRHEVIQQGSLVYGRTAAVRDMDDLIRQHSQLVRRLAWHVHSRMSSTVEIEDLVQIGMIALVEAGRNFEDRGIPFVPYASTRIRGAMIDELRRVSRVCRSGMANRRTLMATRKRLEQLHMRPPTDAEMAQALNLDSAAYHEFVGSAQNVQVDSIDDSYTDHDIWFADGEESADVQMEQAELAQSLAENIASLNEREALVLNLYFIQELNLHEIGEVLQLTPARVCQIKKRALDSLREMMRED